MAAAATVLIITRIFSYTQIDERLIEFRQRSMRRRKTRTGAGKTRK